ncbi:MAG: hypothetical protein KKA60_09465 [Proteobacteria bacterium]|nr:hypothetical protein [Pseudomonadota bacterium]
MGNDKFKKRNWLKSWIPAFAGMTSDGRFSCLRHRHQLLSNFITLSFLKDLSVQIFFSNLRNLRFRFFHPILHAYPL